MDTTMDTEKITRKKRYWHCSTCGKAYRRLRKESAPECCGKDMEKSRTLKKVFKIRNNKVKKQEKIQTLRKRLHGRLRNTRGEILIFSKESKEIWKRLRRTKTVPAFQKYSQVFVDSLRKDLDNHRNNEKWNLVINLYTGEISKQFGGLSGAPKIKITSNTTWVAEDEKRYGTFGRYRRGILHGLYDIEISRDVKDMTAMRETLLHEIIHWFDDLTSTPTNHDSFFWQRLELLKKKFPIHQIGGTKRRGGEIVSQPPSMKGVKNE